MGFKLNYQAGEHLFICGKTGTGKSYGLKELIKTCLKKDYIIVDVKHEDFNDLGCSVVKTPKELMSVLAKGSNKILIQDPQITKTIDIYLQILFKVVKHYTVIVDELHLFTSKHSIPEYLNNTLLMGRSKGKAFWGASQRTQNIHNNVLSQTTHKFSFFLGLERDRDVISQEFDLNSQNISFNDLAEFEFFYKYDKGKTPIQKGRF